MSQTPSLMYLEIVSSRADREDAVRRKSSGLGYFLLIPLFWMFLPYIIAYEFFRMKLH